jgi:hypothetical protein
MGSQSVFSPEQFVDAASLQALVNNASAATSLLAGGTIHAGLINPTSASFTASGLTANISLPLPFQVIFNTGIVSTAHGTTNFVDTQSYSLAFSGLVPVSGSTVTAYALASYQQIQQGSYAVIGPPPGHPDFNPNFQPYISNQLNVDSVSLSATLTPADNVSTFELFRTTLASGATALASFNTTYQRRASGLNNTQVIIVTGNVALDSSYHGREALIVSASTLTLPATLVSNGVNLSFTSVTTAAITINVSGSDLIYGTNGNSGVNFFPLYTGINVQFVCLDGIWQFRGTFSPQPISFDSTYYVSPTGNDTTGQGTSGAPWLTMQHAANWIIQNINFNGHAITVQAADGSYASGVTLAGNIPGNLIFQGNNASGQAGNVSINSPGNCFAATYGAKFNVYSMGVASSVASIATSYGGAILVKNIVFNASAISCLYSYSNGTIQVVGDVQIGANSPAYAIAVQGAVIFLSDPSQPANNMTSSFAPNFSNAFVVAGDGGVIYAPNNTWNIGSASGVRYKIQTNGVIDSNSGNINYFPGNSPGTYVSGGYA